MEVMRFAQEDVIPITKWRLLSGFLFDPSLAWPFLTLLLIVYNRSLAHTHNP